MINKNYIEKENHMPAKLKVNLTTFDLIKGLAILQVFVVHMIWRYDMEQSFFLKLFLIPLSLFSAIMPLFFMISGYGFKPKDASKILSKTFSELIIPYFWVMAANVVLYPIANILFGMPWRQALSETFRYFLTFLLGNPDNARHVMGIPLFDISASWFLLASFVSLNLLNLILKIKKTGLQILLILLSIGFGYFLQTYRFSFFCIAQGMVALGYSYFGYMCKKHKWLEKYYTNPWIYVILVPIALVYHKYGYFNMAGGISTFFPLDYVCSAVFGAVLILVGIYFGQKEWRILDWIKQIGIHTYWILCIHSVEMQALPWHLIAEKMPNNHTLAVIIEIILKAFLVTTVCICLKHISKHNYRKKLARMKQA